MSREQFHFFESKVRPLLVTSCIKCHGEKKQESGLRLDSMASIISGGDSGPAIEPGKPDESLLIDAINYQSFEMPPTGQLGEDEIAILTAWVEMGAPWPDTVAVLAESSGRITAEDRAYWAFQPVRDVSVPEVDSSWCRNPIDRFVLRRLQQEKLSPAPPADRTALIRRVYFDVVGLPPTPEEVDRFVNDPAPDAYERLINRLLDSPRYGERWARHWLDLVRYAESDGYKQDAYRPHAWRYRDYVIRSFNEDKPYDQFVMEQLAGDEIAPHDPDALVATGYLRHWIYEYNQRDVRTQWDGILNDVTDVTGDVFLAMGMGCARCHDHKFDPILQKDYFRLRAFFEPLSPRDDVPLGTPERLADYHARQSEWEQKTADIRRQLDEIESPVRERAARPAIDKFPPDIRPMMSKPLSERTPREQQLANMAYRQVEEEFKKLDIASKLKGDVKKRWESLKQQLSQFDNLKPAPLPPVITVTDVGPVAPATFIPGDSGPDIKPGFLSVIDPSDAAIQQPTLASQATGRRTELARWIASPDNPLSTRVIVNRVWQYHFGQGLVATASDFGRLGEPPSHPELLDWLTKNFLDNGWKFKQLHRLILTSATYRQSAVREMPQVARMKDPSNRLLWKFNSRRLEAEQIRDAMLAVSGDLKPAAGGPSVAGDQPRRTVYTKILRNNRDPLLDVFDAPDNFSSTAARNVTTTPTQSLLMINGPWTLARARSFANRLQRMNMSDYEQLVTQAYRMALGREPDADEVVAAAAFLRQQAHLAVPQLAATTEPATGVIPGRDGHAALLDPGSAQQRLDLPDNPSLPAGDFTVEAIVVLRSLYPDATVRTIASQWDSDPLHPGWAFGVTSDKSKYKPRNLILQLVGNQAKGGKGYEVVASNLRPELNKPYYVAVSAKIGDTSNQGITFYMKDLSRDDAPLQVAHAEHKVDGHYKSNDALTLGGRDRTNRHLWDGLIGECRLSAAAIGPDGLLISDSPANDATVGHWRFEKDRFYDDVSGKDNHLRAVNAATSSDDPRTTALIDFCHVLLNSNEFLYVD